DTDPSDSLVPGRSGISSTAAGRWAGSIRCAAMTDPPTRDCLSVLHVNTQRGWRGGERQTLWLAESLVMLGFRSTIVALRGGELARRAAEAGVRVVAVPSSFELDPRAILAIRRAMGRF